MTVNVIVTNRCQCRRCGDIIESTYRHNQVYCRCNSVYVDGGRDIIIRGSINLDDILEMSETYTMDCNV